MSSEQKPIHHEIASSSLLLLQQEGGGGKEEIIAEVDWEEWDGSSPFWIHCIAGSFAGVIEHSATYPLDTVRTHIQVCASCIQQQQQPNPPRSSASHASSNSSSSALSVGNSSNSILRSALVSSSKHHHHHVGTSTASSTNLPLGMWQTIRYLVSEPALAEAAAASAATTSTTGSTALTTQQMIQGWKRLWSGVQTIVIGCIPAHALYFSSYEIVKNACTDQNSGILPAWGSSAAGAAATLGHDCIMTPLDTIKQRMQLGHYNGSVSEAIRAITASEGYVALYRSFPITLASNLPYGMIMVTTNETCKTLWCNSRHEQRPTTSTLLASSSIAGFVASACTTPLDRIKTALQTQQLQPLCLRSTKHQAASSCVNVNKTPPQNIQQVVMRIYTREGIRGFFRGLTPRVLSHTPAVAISWTTYETTKQYLTKMYS